MKNQPAAIAIPATYEDLLFLNKNKMYGAYVLRKLYKKHMTIACTIAIIAFSVSISSPLIFRDNAEYNSIPKLKYKEIELYSIPDGTKDMGKEKDKKEVEDMVSAVKTQKFTVPVVRPDVLVSSANEVPDVDSLLTAVPWKSTQAGTAGGVDVTLLDVVDVPKNTTDKADTPPAVVNFVAEMPTYPGGDEALLSFFSKEIVYPEIARKAGIEGRVFLNFIIERDGSISNVVIAKGISGGCDEEAVRVLKMLGKWRPGRQNGIPARVRMTIPINFVLK
jgi:protein TonB